MIKAIFFDLQGVLTKHGRMFSQELPEAWEPEVPREETIKRYYFSRIRKKLDKKYFFAGVPLQKKLAFLKISTPQPAAESTVKTLAKKYPLYIASNHIDYIFEKEFAQTKLKKYFTDFIVSKDIGVAKPDEAFFRIMLARAGVKGNEALFIDDAKKNLEGAHRLGISTVWLNQHTDDPSNHNTFTPDFEIHSLKELIPLVKKLS